MDIITSSWQGLGVFVGTVLLVLAGGLYLLHERLTRPRKSRSDEYLSPRQRELIEGLSVQLETVRKDAQEAKIVAMAAQASVNSIGQVISSSIQSLGDRMEGVLREVKSHLESTDEELQDHHGRLRAVETELTITRNK